MGDGFGVGLAGELRALFFQHLPQLAKILDDAVVDHGDIVGRMRMGVVFVRLAVGGPAGMSDTGMARERLGPQSRFQILELAFGAAPIEMVAFQRRDTSGIVTAIFQPLEQIDQLLRDRTASQNADNAAHADQYPQIDEKSPKPRQHLLTRIADAQILNNYCPLVLSKIPQRLQPFPIFISSRTSPYRKLNNFPLYCSSSQKK